MHPKVARRKLKLAVFIARNLDSVFEEMMKDCTIESTFAVLRMQFDAVEKKCLVSPDFVDKSSVPLLISVLMHEARHWKLKHYEQWQQIKKDTIYILAIAPDKFPKEFFYADGRPNMFLMFKVWNLAGDAEINNSMMHVPIVRNDSEAIQAGEYPCTNVNIGDVEHMFRQMVYVQQCREEVVKYLLG